MVQTGDYVNYGTQGICRVEEIRTMKFGGDAEARAYLVLRPVHRKRQCVRAVGQSAAAGADAPCAVCGGDRPHDFECQPPEHAWISDRKEPGRQNFRNLVPQDERELLLLVSCLYIRSKESAKGLSSGDAQILKKAETVIAQEFSFSLRIAPQDIGGYIRGKLGISGETAL